VTLLLDKGSAALVNTVALKQAGVGWISALPWNQAPSLRELPCEKHAPLGDAHPGLQAAAAKEVVHGQEYLCAAVVYSAVFASERLHSITATLTKVRQAISR